MPVQFNRLPAKSAPLLVEIGDLEDVFRTAGGLDLVPVDESRQVIEFEVAGSHGGFPQLAFGLFAIAHDDVDAIGFLVEPEGERHADTDRQALAERSGDGFDAGNTEVRMPLQQPVQFLDAPQFFAREITAFAERGVLDERCVTLGQQQAVTIGGMRIAGIRIHHVEIENGHGFSQRCGSAPVAGDADTDHFQHVITQLLRPLLQFLDLRFSCHSILLFSPEDSGRGVNEPPFPDWRRPNITCNL